MWCTVVVGVRLTVGLYGTIVHRPSTPSLRTSMDGFNTFSFFVVKSWFLAIHGWLTGVRIEEGFAAAIPFSCCSNGQVSSGGYCFIHLEYEYNNQPKTNIRWIQNG
nr:hypothetical protein [Priestia megaterium]